MTQLYKLLFLVVAVCLLESCVIPKKAADSLIIKKIKHDPASIREAAGFAIGQTYATNIRYFEVSEISDENLRNKISQIGNLGLFHDSCLRHRDSVVQGRPVPQ